MMNSDRSGGIHGSAAPYHSALVISVDPAYRDGRAVDVSDETVVSFLSPAGIWFRATSDMRARRTRTRVLPNLSRAQRADVDVGLMGALTHAPSDAEGLLVRDGTPSDPRWVL